MSDRVSLDELIAALTPVEREIAELVAEGRSNDDVATRRFVSVKTVEFHLTRIYRKLGVRSRAQVIAVWPRVDVPSDQIW
jgi:DNA-binding CsgD family transcriptional regulator